MCKFDQHRVRSDTDRPPLSDYTENLLILVISQSIGASLQKQRPLEAEGRGYLFFDFLFLRPWYLMQGLGICPFLSTKKRPLLVTAGWRPAGEQVDGTMVGTMAERWLELY